MKKILNIILGLLLCFMLSSCGTSSGLVIYDTYYDNYPYATYFIYNDSYYHRHYHKPKVEKHHKPKAEKHNYKPNHKQNNRKYNAKPSNNRRNSSTSNNRRTNRK